MTIVALSAPDPSAMAAPGLLAPDRAGLGLGANTDSFRDHLALFDQTASAPDRAGGEAPRDVRATRGSRGNGAAETPNRGTSPQDPAAAAAAAHDDRAASDAAAPDPTAAAEMDAPPAKTQAPTPNKTEPPESAGSPPGHKGETVSDKASTAQSSGSTADVGSAGTAATQAAASAAASASAHASVSAVASEGSLVGAEATGAQATGAQVGVLAVGGSKAASKPGQSGDATPGTPTGDSAASAASGQNSAESAKNDSAALKLSAPAPTPQVDLSNGPLAHAAASANAAHGAAAGGNAGSPATPLVPLAPDRSEGDANIARVARGLQTAIQQNGGTVTLRLQPPEMGVVRVLMEIRNGTASVEFQTEHEGARTLLSHQLESLRSALESHGLGVEKLDVQMTPRQATTGGQGQSGGQTPDDGRSRGQLAGDQGRPRERSGGGGSAGGNGGGLAVESSFAQTMVNLVG